MEYEKNLEISKQSLPLNHPDFTGFYNNIGVVYEDMGNYSKARSFYERIVEIGQQSFPSNHPHLQIYRDNLKDVKKEIVISISVFFLEKKNKTIE
jgi:tetratricopeptide (TPR) repeat protein